jgi:probable phosphoglycerate mutase
LVGRSIEVIYSSPLSRALETARTLAQTLDRPVHLDPRLKEIHAGIFQDKLRSEIDHLYPAEIAHWISNDPDFVIPGGESQRQLAERGVAAFQAIADAGHQEAAVVAHGRLLVITIKALLGIPPVQAPQSLQNASITTLQWIDDGRVELAALDQIEHLRGVGVSGRGDL